MRDPGESAQSNMRTPSRAIAQTDVSGGHTFPAFSDPAAPGGVPFSYLPPGSVVDSTCWSRADEGDSGGGSGHIRRWFSNRLSLARSFRRWCGRPGRSSRRNRRPTDVDRRSPNNAEDLHCGSEPPGQPRNTKILYGVSVEIRKRPTSLTILRSAGRCNPVRSRDDPKVCTRRTGG